MVTEPSYEEYEKFTVETDTKYGNDNEEIFNNNKEIYTGKTLYYNFYLNETLTKNCQNKGCLLCLSNNINFCITCNSNYSIINNEKICQQYHCTNQEVINNKCLFERISNDQAKEIYNELIDRIKNNSINSTIVQTENFIFQISDSEDQKNNNLNISTINLGECGSILKNNTNSSLILLKVDSRNEDLTSTYVFFEIFNSKDINNKIDLNLCKDIPIEIRVPKKLDNTTLIYYSSLIFLLIFIEISFFL